MADAIIRGELARRVAAHRSQLGLNLFETNCLPYREYLAKLREHDAFREATAQIEAQCGLADPRHFYLDDAMNARRQAIEAAYQLAAREPRATATDSTDYARREEDLRRQRIRELRMLMGDHNYTHYALSLSPEPRGLGGFAASLEFFEPTESEFIRLIGAREQYAGAFRELQPGDSLTPLDQARERVTMQEEFRQLLGEQRYGEYQAKTDPGFRASRALAAELGFSDERAEALLSLHRRAMRRLEAIPPAGGAARDNAWREIESQLQRELGSTGYGAYSRTALGAELRAWMRMSGGGFMRASTRNRETPSP